MLYNLGNQPNITKVILEKDAIATGSIFEGCTGVEEVILYDAYVNTLSDFANLKTITIKKGAGQNINGSVSSSIEKLIVEDNAILSISCSSSNLSEIVLEENVTINSVFGSCEMLTSVKIPGSTKFNRIRFSNCANLTDVELGEGLKSIPEIMFANCKSLTNINIPNSVTSIGHNAFNGCTGLTNIELPSSVTNIEKNAFAGCSNLKITVKSEKTYKALIESGFTDETKIVKDY